MARVLEVGLGYKEEKQSNKRIYLKGFFYVSGGALAGSGTNRFDTISRFCLFLFLPNMSNSIIYAIF